MENFQFTEEELKYINDDIFNKENNIHATLLISDKYYIYATLPQGWYNFTVAENEKMDCLNHLRDKGVNANITYSGIFLNINEPRIVNILVATNCDKIVKDLRSILVLMNKKERLIAKDIKAHTDLGEDYNRESFEDTILDYFNDDEDLVVDFTKSPKDSDVKYLQLMKLMQDKNRHEIKQQKLDMEACELAIRENKLMRS